MPVSCRVFFFDRHKPGENDPNFWTQFFYTRSGTIFYPTAGCRPAPGTALLDMLEDSKNSQDRKLNDISNHFKESEGSLKNLILKKFASSSNKFNGEGVEKLAEEIKKIEHHLLELKSKTEEKYQFFETQLEEKLAASNLPENYHETVLSQLRKYDADKTAQIDWAYFNSGGQVVKASPPYTGRPGLVSFLGLPLFYKYKKPDLVIQPDVNPGSCFAFAGSKGFILLKFATDMKMFIKIFNYKSEKLFLK